MILRFVACTAWTGESYRELALSAGFDYFLCKPITH